MIEAKHLSKRFRNKIAVHDLSFQVETGKITGFLGPNGAGKSTTMRLMLGLSIGGGLTTYDGKRLREYPGPAQVVGILLDAKSFHPTRTARNHLRVLAAAGGVSDQRVDEVLEMVGLKSEAMGHPGKFSLGMSQRLGIAAAILSNPRHLILDEPANGLDPEGIAWLRQFLKDYADHDRAVFVSSHLLSEMAQMADNVVVIGKGKVIADTSIESLVASSGHSTVFVRASDQGKLEQLFKRRSLNYEQIDGGIAVSGITIDKIGDLAFTAGIPLHELTNRSASLEDVFLELTEGAEEFQGHAVRKGSED